MTLIENFIEMCMKACSFEKSYFEATYGYY